MRFCKPTWLFFLYLAVFLQCVSPSLFELFFQFICSVCHYAPYVLSNWSRFFGHFLVFGALFSCCALSFQGPCATPFGPTLSLPMPWLLFLTPDRAAFPPSACNIHLGECCHDETHVLMLTRTLPWALFTASVTYHQIKAASEGWKYEQAPYIRHTTLRKTKEQDWRAVNI